MQLDIKDRETRKMSWWSKSYLIHAGIWFALVLVSLFMNVGMFIFGAFIFVVATLFWTPLGYLSGLEDPHMAKWDASDIPDILAIAWFGFLTMIAVFLIHKAIQKWRHGAKTPMRLLFHSMIFVVGVFLVAIMGSINFPFSL
ncbi:MAG: hypothetical protein OIF58_02145 [Cohaesibacter sp.]|nr:hypothetical protein [Cohaesibacter sp.]